MRILAEEEKERAMPFILLAKQEARKATCKRAKCGAVIITKEGNVIGCGHNSPPGEAESQRRCRNKKSDYHNKVTDKTCCVHAEVRAIMDALRRNADGLRGSVMYFVRMDKEDDVSDFRKPYCTLCSKLIFDVGITCFTRLTNGKIVEYDTGEYNNISYAYSE